MKDTNIMAKMIVFKDYKILDGIIQNYIRK